MKHKETIYAKDLAFPVIVAGMEVEQGNQQEFSLFGVLKHRTTVEIAVGI